MHKLSYLFFTGGLVLLLAGCSSDEPQRASQGPVGPNADASEIAAVIETAAFTDLDGNEVTLEDFRGKVLLIDFWESWCGPCLQVFPAMQQLREEYPDHFEVLAVTLGMTEGPEEARAFRAEHGYDFHFLYDEFNISGDLNIFSIPYKIYIDPDGKMIRQELGSKGRDGDYNSAKELITEYLD